MNTWEKIRGYIFIISGIVIAAGSGISLESCTVIQQTAIINNVNIDGNIHQVPIRVNDGNMTGHVRITPNISILPVQRTTGTIKVPTYNAVELLPRYDSLSNNLRMNLPTYVIGLGLDYGLSDLFSLSADGNYYRVDGKQSFESDIGLALTFGGDQVASRLEAGAEFESSSYSAVIDQYKVFESGGLFNLNVDSAAYKSSYTTSGNNPSVDFYVNFTMNSRIKHSRVNWFARVGYGFISILSPSLPSAQNEQRAVGFLTFTPGVFYDINDWSRLVVGCRFMSATSGFYFSPNWLISPVAQVDFTI